MARPYAGSDPSKRQVAYTCITSNDPPLGLFDARRFTPAIAYREIGSTVFDSILCASFKKDVGGLHGR
jgi:hypothetical protein